MDPLDYKKGFVVSYPRHYVSPYDRRSLHPIFPKLGLYIGDTCVDYFVYMNGGWCITPTGLCSFHRIVLETIPESIRQDYNTKWSVQILEHNKHVLDFCTGVKYISPTMQQITKYATSINVFPQMRLLDFIIIEYKNKPFICRFGELTDSVRKVFSNGNCEIFAVALNKYVEWRSIQPMQPMQQFQLKTLQKDGVNIHVYGCLSNGDVVDVHGIRPFGDMIKMFVEPTDKYEIIDYSEWVENDVWFYILKKFQMEIWAPIYRYVLSVAGQILQQ